MNDVNKVSRLHFLKVSMGVKTSQARSSVTTMLMNWEICRSAMAKQPQKSCLVVETSPGFMITRWWFRFNYLFIFTPTWGNDPIYITKIFQTGLKPPARTMTLQCGIKKWICWTSVSLGCKGHRFVPRCSLQVGGMISPQTSVERTCQELMYIFDHWHFVSYKPGFIIMRWSFLLYKMFFQCFCCVYGMAPVPALRNRI